jgi:hypothetical protein
MNPAHQRGQPSTSSVRSFDETSDNATDYISGMYQDTSEISTHPPTSKKNGLPPLQTSSLSPDSALSKSSNNSRSQHQRRISNEKIPTTSPQSKSPTHTRPRLKSPSPSHTQIPLSGLEDDIDGSSPSSPAEIAKELFNLQAFKRMSLDVSNQVSDPDLPSNRMALPDYSELLEAGVDQDAARLLWVPGMSSPT